MICDSTGPVNASNCVKQCGATPLSGTRTDSVWLPVVIEPVAESTSDCGVTKPSASLVYTANPMAAGSHNGSALATVKVAWLPSLLIAADSCIWSAGVHPPPPAAWTVVAVTPSARAITADAQMARKITFTGARLPLDPRFKPR